MNRAIVPEPDKAGILAEAFTNAGRYLSMRQVDLGKIIGKDRTAISRGRVEPGSKSGELALLFIRCYRALYSLTGGNPRQMAHWMHTENRHTGGVPAEQVKTVQGLITVLEYLDAIRGKL